MSGSAPAQRAPLVVIGVDQEWFARSLETVLGPHGFALVRARSGQHTVELAASVQPDVILVDSRLPDIDGVDVCRRLRDDGGVEAHVPVVLMASAAPPRDFVREAYQAGVWSVWEQPLDGELLVLRLRTWVDAKRRVDVAEQARDVDEAADLYTVRGLQRRAREIVADAARRQTPVACIAVGALVAAPPGEAAERTLPLGAAEELRKVLTGVVRTADVVGCTGAGEFTILAPATTRDGAFAMVERIRERVARLPVYMEHGERVRPVVRAGISMADAEDRWHPDGTDLLRRAATALRYAHASRSADSPTFADVPASFV